MKQLSRRADDYRLVRRDVVGRILKNRPDLLLIGGLGPASWDCTAAGDRDLNFMLWGAMGGAVPIGLGLALAQPDRPVMVITGDGEMMMGMGSLALVAMQQPRNLHIVVLDNERFEETGGQLTPTAGCTDLQLVATGCGIEQSATIRDEVQLQKLIGEMYVKPGPAFSVIKVRAENEPMVTAPKDGNELRIRFRRALLGVA